MHNINKYIYIDCLYTGSKWLLSELEHGGRKLSKVYTWANSPTKDGLGEPICPNTSGAYKHPAPPPPPPKKGKVTTS